MRLMKGLQFKMHQQSPTGLSEFATFEGLPSDYYLWLVGTASKMLRGEIPSNRTSTEKINLHLIEIFNIRIVREFS